VSSAELSLDISRLVSRALGGEPIDIAGQSAELAVRHADLGMSAELIAKAIARAAGMVGVALDGGEEILVRPVAEAASTPDGEAANGFHANGALADPASAAAAEAAELRRIFLGE
jgi:hypothetical protein